MYLAYSSYMILGVSSMISLTEHVNLWSVIKKNYLYYQVASLASIPITIVMIYLWFQEGSVGVILLALPLLLVSIGVNIAFERGRLEERARRDSQLAELGKTAASILHEIKRPISRILMTAEYGLSTTGARDDKEKFGQILDWSAQVRDISKSLLLNLSGKLTVEKARVLSIVDSVIEILSAKYPGRILFDRDPNQDLVVFWDSQSIAMVLQNLITNSLEISESALVTITLEQLINRRGLFARDGSVLITISDTGPGLPAVETERLFDPLFTTRPDGSGIGLFIARQIVLAHGGTLNARTLREGGAEFSVQIPVRTALVSA